MPEKMVVEKRGELKNKMILGSDVVEPRNPLLMAPPDCREIVYYVLDLNTAEVSSLPRIVFGNGCQPPPGVVGSTLYVFGGGKSFSSGDSDDSAKSKPKKGKRKQKGLFSCHMLDLTKPKDGWRLATAGLDQSPAVRANGAWPEGIVEFGGKIYVFDNSESGFIGEVFDPQHNNWRRLKSPPFPPPPCGDGDQLFDYRTLTLPVMADHKRNRIMVYFQYIKTIYAYYPCEDQWRCLVEDLKGGWLRWGEPVTIADDGVIYIHNPRMKAFFRAYDTVTKEWLNVRLSPEAEAKADYQSYLIYREYDALLHRGNGVLCLIHSALPWDDIPSFEHIVQFKVQLVNLNANSKEVLVTPLSSQNYNLPSRCCTFHYLPV
ncbi:uncharacterized protein LOC130803515 [Amaranthus tricolor]|uniref:uncharacterized protein LOC130803515 n=1 Tax=Amaranthus tricolor TaxID=29722 RepID=UPI0025838E75|nr:uncharacterized protein LOC130803515 [Amaranthus tricolor]